jgi:dynein heavy chain
LKYSQIWKSKFVNLLICIALKSCRRECTLAKQLWDYVFVVRSSVDNWKLTYWKEIDVERLEIECKHYAKDIRNLDKEMRPWGAYMGLEASVRDLLTSLKAISDLQNPAVKERHWSSLIEATKRKTTTGKEEKLLTINFVNDSETTLGDLLALQLHRYEEEVRSVVDRAVREISMEKTLRELEATWANVELDKEMHNRTGLTLLKASDDLIAILEDNQVTASALQNLALISFKIKFHILLHGKTQMALTSFA